MTKILKLEIENVKRIRAASIEPDGSVVVVGGLNSAGKSSALDAIAYALGGKALCPDEPLRRGEKRGVVKINLGDYTVERVFTKKSSRLIVRSADGLTTPGGPQELLDKIIGDLKLNFDPMAFLRKSRPDQLDVLKKLVGVDCDDLDKQRQDVYDGRTAVNRDVKALKARVEAIPVYEDAPESEVSVSDLMVELDKREEANQQNLEERTRLSNLRNAGVKARASIKSLENKISELRRELADRRSELAGVLDEYKYQASVVDALKDEDTNEVRARITASEKVNRQVRSNTERAELEKDLEYAKATASGYTGQIEMYDKAKADRLAAAEFPVDGLSFDENGVTLNGLPFDQAGQAEQIRVAVAIAFASGADLRIALVRDGSLLDDDSRALLQKCAEEADGQVWLEVVGVDPEATVLFEDGEVVER